MATVTVSQREDVPAHLRRVGTRLYRGLEQLSQRYGALGSAVSGVPEMCYLAFAEAGTGWHLASLMAARGIIWKPTAYNFVSLAHTEAHIDQTLSALDEALGDICRQPRARGAPC